MRKKILTTMLSLAMVASLLVGCGTKEPTNTTETNDSTVQTEVSSETEDETNTIGDAANDVVNSVKEYTADDIANSINSSKFGMEAEESELKFVVAIDGDNMVMGYKYFVPESFFQDMPTDESNVNYNLDEIKAAGGYDMEVSLYKLGEDVYCASNIEGTTKYYKLSKAETSEETVDELFADTPEENVGFNTDKIADVQYIETIEYNGRMVDVVEVTTYVTEDEENEYESEVEEVESEVEEEIEESDVEASTDEEMTEVNTIYIDAETKLMTAIVMTEATEDGSDMIINITHDDITLPSEFDNAEEISSEDLMMHLMTIMMIPMSVEDVNIESSIEE